MARPRSDSRELYESVAVFSARDRIVLARSYAADPLVAFSPRGKLDPGFARRLKGLVPPYPPKASARVGPAASLDGDKLIFAWSSTQPGGSAGAAAEGVLNLRRILLGSG